MDKLNIGLCDSFSLVQYVQDRPGHDLRYAINNNKIMRDLKWEPKTKIEEGLKKTISWYLNNQDWWGKYI